MRGCVRPRHASVGSSAAWRLLIPHGKTTLQALLTRLTWPERLLNEVEVVYSDTGESQAVSGAAVQEIGREGLVLRDARRIGYARVLRVEMFGVSLWDRHAETTPRGRGVVCCGTCNTIVSRAVVPAAIPSTPRDGHALVPEGGYRLGDGNLGEPGSLLLDLDDVQLQPGDPLRRVGCCGCSGEHGPNLVCACGDALATEYSDCLVPHFVEFDRSATWFLPRRQA